MELKDIDFEQEDFAVDIPDKTEEKKNNVEYEYDDDSDKARRKPLFVILLVIAFLLTSTLVAILILYAGRDLFIREEEQAEVIITEETPIYTQADVDEMIETAVNKATEEKQRETEDSMKKMFREVSEEDNGVLMMLREFNPDDMIFITEDNREMQSYHVYANELLLPDDMEKLTVIAGQAENTLVVVSCENESVEGGYLNRRVVFAEKEF